MFINFNHGDIPLIGDLITVVLSVKHARKKKRKENLSKIGLTVRIKRQVLGVTTHLGNGHEEKLVGRKVYHW